MTDYFIADEVGKGLVSTVRREPSVRADGAWDALVPDNWAMDEWRGGGCAALVIGLEVEEQVWEVVLMADGDLRIPSTADSGWVWTITANRYDEDLGGTYVPANGLELNLPPYREGENFPTGHVLAWVHDLVVSDMMELV